MLHSTGADVPRSGRISPRIDTPSSTKTAIYLNTGDLYKNDTCHSQDSAQRLVTTSKASSLLAQANPTIPDSQGNTPLCLAAQAGNLAQAQQLIQKGADIHHINLDGDNPFTLAATGGHLTFIRWLNSHCQQPVNHENYYGDTALTLAARHGHQPAVQWLVSQGANLAHFNDQFKDALAEAVANGHLALAQWLLSQDADLKRVYPDGNNLFLHAVRAGHQGMVQWLEDSGVDGQQINESGDNALTLAAHHGHHQLLARFLGKNAAGIDHIGRNGDSLLLMAARQGHSQTVKLLVQHGANIGQTNYARSSVLTLAAASSESLALWLCNKGTDIHHIESSGDNAFTRAARSGFFQLMQTLERSGINIHQVNQDNDNAFTLVARQGSLPWCQWLAGKGINIHQVNCYHHNAVTLAALAGSLPLLRWLGTENVDREQIPMIPVYGGDDLGISGMHHSFNAAILAASAGHFAEAQWLTTQGLSIYQRDYFARNAVIQAVALGQLEAVKWFAAQGILPDRFPDGFPDCFKSREYNAMGLAACLGHLHILQWLHQNGGSLDEDCIKILLDVALRCGNLPITQWLYQQGTDMELFGSSEGGTLSTAVRFGHLRLSQWLVSRGADDILDDEYNDAVILATQGGHNAIFRWLTRSRSLDNRQANELLLHALRSGHRSLAVWLCLNVCSSISGADFENQNALMLAARNGFLWLTKWLSERTPDINQANFRGRTALMLAAARGHLPVVQWLYLEKNANLHHKAPDHSDALHLAVFWGQTETVNWLLGQGMVLNPNFFRLRRIAWTNTSDKVGLLRCLLRQQFPASFFSNAMVVAAREGDVSALACCLSAGVGLESDHGSYDSYCHEAACSGSLATLEYLCYSAGNYNVDMAKKVCLSAAARCGNLHIIQWFWVRSRLSTDEQHACLLVASGNDHFHVVKWLHGQGVNIGAKTVSGFCGLSAALCHGNTPILEWFCRQGEDLHQVKENDEDALSLAIHSCQPLVARWLFRRGFRLKERDIKYAFFDIEVSVLCMIFKMTSGIRRANFFHSLRRHHKLWLLHVLQLDSDCGNLSEKEADACFARFNRYNDKTLEHKCLVALATCIGQQSDTLEAGLKVVDSLPIIPECKFNLRELVSINLKK